MPFGSHGVRRITESIEKNDTAFGTRVADSTTNRLDLPGTYDFNTERHRFIDDLTTSNGTFISDLSNTTALSDKAGKFQITASAGEEHVFGARERLRYVPNYELLFGAAVWAEDALEAGQHFSVELSNDAANDGYRYHFAGTSSGYTLTLEQFQGSTTAVDSVTVNPASVAKQFDPTAPSVKRGFLNWYGTGVFRATLSYPQTDDAGDVSGQANPVIGRTANLDDVATNQINLRVQTRVWADTGASDITVNISSIGALIRGNVTEVDRQKVGTFWDLGGTISQYPTDNVGDALAARVDPERPEVAVNMETPLFQPAGGSGVTMGLGVYAVENTDSNLTVNFKDPDDDGTDEGAAPTPQTTAQNDVMEYTRDLTAIPTRSGIRADGSTGTIPDMRQLTTTIAEAGSRHEPGRSTGGEQEIKRPVYENDVVIFLPRTDPSGSTTDASIQFLKPIFEQDW